MIVCTYKNWHKNTLNNTNKSHAEISKLLSSTYFGQPYMRNVSVCEYKPYSASAIARHVIASPVNVYD